MRGSEAFTDVLDRYVQAELLARKHELRGDKLAKAVGNYGSENDRLRRELAETQERCRMLEEALEKKGAIIADMERLDVTKKALAATKRKLEVTIRYDVESGEWKIWDLDWPQEFHDGRKVTLSTEYE